MTEMSIVIPTFKEAKHIDQTLNGIEKLDGDIEVIVVETTSNETAILEKIVKKHRNIQLYKIKERGIAKARNYGAQKASSDIILFLDADVLVTEDLIGKISRVFRNPHVVGATCNFYPVKPRFSELFFFKFYNTLIRLVLGLPLIKRLKHTSGIFIVVRKAHFNSIGGFNENLVCLEDGDLAYRLSFVGRFVFMNDLVVYESLRRIRKLGLFKTVKSWFKNWLFYVITGNVVVEEWKPIR